MVGTLFSKPLLGDGGCGPRGLGGAGAAGAETEKGLDSIFVDLLRRGCGILYRERRLRRL